MKPCRDCGAPTAPSARSCPHCGILNPVQQWVSMPNGEHLTHREPVSPGAAAAALRAAPAGFGAMAAPAPAFVGAPSAAAATAILAKPRATGEPGFGDDKLASWAIWSVLFALLSTFVIGGLIGGAIAALLAVPIGKALPTRDDGRKLPVPVSAVLIALSIALFFGRIFLGVAALTATP